MYTEWIYDFTYNDKEYCVYKMIETKPQRISYSIFDNTDTLVFRCEMSFISNFKYQELDYQSFYTELDILIAADMEQHFIKVSHKDNLMTEFERNNRKQFDQIKLAKFDAKVEKERLKKEKAKKDT